VVNRNLKVRGNKMKKLLTTAALLGSVLAVSACATDGSSQEDETLTQAPYAEERTVGPEDKAQVRSAEPVFERRQVK
jgi:hypothetical protein